MQRTKRSFINVTTTVITNFIILFTAFAVQRVLVHTMGGDYNGLNGLFSSIISMMSLADLGIGTAIIYHMYRPVAEEDHERINSLLHFYKKCYMVISGIILLIGIVVSFFLPALVGDAEIHDSIYLIFALFLIDCLCSYFLAYKKSLLYASQMNYVADLIYFAVYVVQNAAQIFVLLAFQDFILFLIVKSLGKCISNLVLSVYIGRKFPYTRAKQVKPVEKETKQDIYLKVRGLLYHKVGKLLVTGSDSIVLTGVLGIATMNLYANYHLIIGGIAGLLYRIFETLTNSVGNFLLDSDQDRRLDVYKKIDFINFWFFGCVAAGIYAVIQPLILLWMGENFLFAKTVVFVLVINFYLDGMRASVTTFKEAAGIFHEDRHIPVIEALLNLFISIILAKFIGVSGVFLGTILSTGVVYLYSYPKYVCRPLFRMSYGKYVGQTFRHLALLFVILGLTEVAVRPMEGWNPWLRIFTAGTASVIIFHAIFLLLYGRSAEMRFYINFLRNKLHKSQTTSDC